MEPSNVERLGALTRAVDLDSSRESTNANQSRPWRARAKWWPDGMARGRTSKSHRRDEAFEPSSGESPTEAPGGINGLSGAVAERHPGDDARRGERAAPSAGVGISRATEPSARAKTHRGRDTNTARSALGVTLAYPGLELDIAHLRALGRPRVFSKDAAGGGEVPGLEAARAFVRVVAHDTARRDGHRPGVRVGFGVFAAGALRRATAGAPRRRTRLAADTAHADETTRTLERAEAPPSRRRDPGAHAAPRSVGRAHVAGLGGAAPALGREAAG